MKYLSILIISLLVSSCCGTKKAIESQKEPTTNIAAVKDNLDIVETTEPKNDDGEIHEMVVIVDKEGKTIAEVSSHNEAKEFLKEEPIIEHETTFEYFNHLIWKELLNNNVNKNGKVDYNGFKKEAKKLRSYIDSLAINIPNKEWPKEDKIAYWINAYNALTVDLIIKNYPLNSIKDIKEPWDQRLWKFGDKWLNLNDIEHKILRKMDEPRIHFAIVCASESCPKLRNIPFYATSLDEDLADATKEFLSDTSKNELSENSIKLSKIFKWFAKDFKHEGTLIDFLNQYSEITISSKAKKSFKDYNWDLNE